MKGKCGVDDLIDAIEGNRVYMPALYVINKIDQITIEELDLLDQIPNYVLISAHKVFNLIILRDGIWMNCWKEFGKNLIYSEFIQNQKYLYF